MVTILFRTSIENISYCREFRRGFAPPTNELKKKKKKEADI